MLGGRQNDAADRESAIGRPVSSPRDALASSRRLVVKIGSSVLAERPDLPRRLAHDLGGLLGEGRSAVLVSSGAIALGCQKLGYRERPQEMAKLQAAAAAGQSELMRRYDEALSELGVTSAQVLLTHTDLSDRVRLNNARDALNALLDAGALPIVNENDTVSTEEIAFGDNDQLAAMVVPLVSADLLVLLTAAEGVLDADGQRVGVLQPAEEVPTHRATSSVGSGGIQSKIDAARKAARSGAHVVIAPATEIDVVSRVLSGADIGTLVTPSGPQLRARQHWIAYTLRPRGTLLVDAGAAAALRQGRSSLLPVGIVGVRGTFNVGDAVRVEDPNGVEIARGLSRLGALDVARAAGKRRKELEVLFGDERDLVVLHKDDLVSTVD